MRELKGIAVLLTALAMMSAGGGVMADQELTYDRVDFSVSVEEDVANDTLVAVLFVQKEGQKQASVSNQVNETMSWALERAKRSPAVRSQTLSYNTNPVYSDRRIVGWRAQQSLRLESTDSDKLTGLMGELQSRMGVQSVNYEVSKSARDAAQGGLIERAIGQFRARADRIAASMQRPGWRLVRMNIGTGGHNPGPRVFHAQMARAEADVAAPSLQAGDQSISVSISGQIELESPQ